MNLYKNIEKNIIFFHFLNFLSYLLSNLIKLLFLIYDCSQSFNSTWWQDYKSLLISLTIYIIISRSSNSGNVVKSIEKAR